MKRKSISKAMRQKVLDKYGGRCAYCGKELDLKTLRVDHLHPHYRGGEDSFENYMPACYQCNFYKSTFLKAAILCSRVLAALYIFFSLLPIDF